MAELKIEPVNGGDINKIIGEITSDFNVSVRRKGDEVILVGHEGIIGRIRTVLSAKVI